MTTLFNWSQLGRVGNSKKYDKFLLATRMIRGGVFARPKWWDEARFSPAPYPVQPLVSPPVLVLPEDRLVKVCVE